MSTMEMKPIREEADLVPSLSEAATQVLAIMQTELQKGAVDTEAVAFQKILSELSEGNITPQEAIEQARAIAAARQDYH